MRVVEHVPGGGLLRDAQKWAMPWVLLASACFGPGVERVAARLPRPSGAVVAACLLRAPGGRAALAGLGPGGSAARGAAGRPDWARLPRCWVRRPTRWRRARAALAPVPGVGLERRPHRPGPGGPAGVARAWSATTTWSSPTVRSGARTPGPAGPGGPGRRHAVADGRPRDRDPLRRRRPAHGGRSDRRRAAPARRSRAVARRRPRRLRPRSGGRSDRPALRAPGLVVVVDLLAAGLLGWAVVSIAYDGLRSAATLRAVALQPRRRPADARLDRCPRRAAGGLCSWRSSPGGFRSRWSLAGRQPGPASSAPLVGVTGSALEPAAASAAAERLDRPVPRERVRVRAAHPRPSRSRSRLVGQHLLAARTRNLRVVVDEQPTDAVVHGLAQPAGRAEPDRRRGVRGRLDHDQPPALLERGHGQHPARGEQVVLGLARRRARGRSIRSWIPSARACRASRADHQPEPTTSTRSPGTVSASSATACRASSTRLCGTSRPRTSTVGCVGAARSVRVRRAAVRSRCARSRSWSGRHAELDEVVRGGPRHGDVRAVAVDPGRDPALQPPAERGQRARQHHPPLLAVHVVHQHHDGDAGSTARPGTACRSAPRRRRRDGRAGRSGTAALPTGRA